MIALSTGACAGEPSSTACIASTESALYGAESDPESLVLTQAQRAAIVAVVAEGTSGPDMCTGTFVSHGLVLTAAHCDLRGAMEVVVTDDIVEAHGARLAVLRRHKHALRDLMLLEVESPAELGPIEPIPVLEANAEPAGVGELAELAGFGKTETGESGQLRFAAETIVTVDEGTIIVDGAGRSGGCFGDSGGPLLRLGSGPRARVAGVLSEGSPDCTGIDVYARPDPAWIEAAGVAAAADCREQ